MPADIPVHGEGQYDPNATSRFVALGATGELPKVVMRSLLPEEAAAIDSLPAGSALLIAQSGPNSGARFLLNVDEVNAGRHVRSDIFLDDVTVSRRHATFVRDAGGYRIRDNGSLNGTYVNRERIDDVLLSTGDEVQVGKFRLTYYGSQAQQ